MAEGGEDKSWSEDEVEDFASRVPRRARAIVLEVVEELDADSVVLLYTRTRRNRTTAYRVRWGNSLACMALVDLAATIGEDDLDDDEDEGEDFGGSGSSGD